MFLKYYPEFEMSQASYSVDQILSVLDKADGKKRQCKVVEVDLDKKRILIHYMRWNRKYDEYLEFDSEYIVKSGSDESSDEFVETFDEPPDSEMKESFGRLLSSLDEEAKKVIAIYDIRCTYNNQNEKSFNKCPVSLLEHSAEAILIKTKDDRGKKLYNKTSLVRKIEALLPTHCNECQIKYSIKLGVAPLFTCYNCFKPSHDCEVVKQFHSLLPRTILSGFVWMCSECFISPGIAETENRDETSNSQEVTGNQQESVNSNSQLGHETTIVNNAIEHEQSNSICPDYKRGCCPHGLRGNRLVDSRKCPNSHPKSCCKFTSFGSKEASGCMRGKNCKFFHPVLCKFSVKKRICTKKDCTFVHLKGTARREPVTVTKTEQKPGVKSNVPKSGADIKSDNLPNDNFLRLEKMIEAIGQNYDMQLAG